LTAIIGSQAFQKMTCRLMSLILKNDARSLARPVTTWFSFKYWES
jgi:hypothetical protein